MIENSQEQLGTARNSSNGKHSQAATANDLKSDPASRGAQRGKLKLFPLLWLTWILHPSHSFRAVPYYTFDTSRSRVTSGEASKKRHATPLHTWLTTYMAYIITICCFCLTIYAHKSGCASTAMHPKSLSNKVPNRLRNTLSNEPTSRNRIYSQIGSP